MILQEKKELYHSLFHLCKGKRSERKATSEAYYGFLAENEEELDRIYDELVKVRTKIAKSLGFKNFVELGYARMYRTDYNAEMVANYRQQVLDYIVPVTTELRKRQQARIGVEKLAYYDENFEFLQVTQLQKEMRIGLLIMEKRCIKSYRLKQMNFSISC